MYPTMHYFAFFFKTKMHQIYDILLFMINFECSVHLCSNLEYSPGCMPFHTNL